MKIRSTENKCQVQAPKILVEASIKAGVGAICSLLLRNVVPIHPIAGAIFGFTHGVMQHLLRPGVSEFFDDPNGLLSKVAIFVLSLLASVGVAVLTSAALGYAITIKAAIILSIAMIPLTLLVVYVSRCVLETNSRPVLL